MQEILSPLRSAAVDAVEDLMTEAFIQVGALLLCTSREAGRALSFDRQACGLSSYLLKQIYDHAAAGTLEDWLVADAAKDRYRKVSDFLDMYRMQREDLRIRFPRAFQKWTPEEDAELLRPYHAATDGGRKVRWREFVQPFGRNENAVKLRLERLGIDLGDDSGMPRRK